MVRRGDCDPVTVAAFDYDTPVADSFGLCSLLGNNREGFGSPLAGVFQRNAVTPDGSGVVFEITNQFQLIGKFALPPEQQGFFYVRADGTGLRRLGPPSAEPVYRVFVSTTSGQPTADFSSHMTFDPSGRRFAFTDRGPAPDGRDTVQIFTIDIGTGERRQVTHLPAGGHPIAGHSVTDQVIFETDHLITFETFAFGPIATYVINVDGSGLKPLKPLPGVVVSGFHVVDPVFQVTGPIGRDVLLQVPGTPHNHLSSYADVISEIFRSDADGRLLQLTNFRNVDTYGLGTFGRRLRSLVVASADSLGENPTRNCQFFSVDTLGAGVRQLTHLDDAGAQSTNGCDFTAPPGCAFAEVFPDPARGRIVFESNCSPFGSNPLGSQVFSMRADGRELRQLTHTDGARTASDGTFSVEMPGPIAYSVQRRCEPVDICVLTGVGR